MNGMWHTRLLTAMIRTVQSSLTRSGLGVNFNKRNMNKTQENLLTKIGESYKLKITFNDKVKEIEALAFKLLDELKKIDGWEVLFQHCKDHYDKYPNDFFSWCYVSYDSHSVDFNKHYSNGDDYVVLTINLSEDLKTQVERVKGLVAEKEADEMSEIERREREELKRLKAKYETPNNEKDNV